MTVLFMYNNLLAYRTCNLKRFYSKYPVIFILTFSDILSFYIIISISLIHVIYFVFKSI